MGRLFALGLGIAACCAALVEALDAASWKQRSVYQLLTDRFALRPADRDTCDDPGCEPPKGYGNYCGGTFEAVADNLDYITGMGFDAIWISPIVDNIACGYHGYWAQHQFQIESHFGGSVGLHKLMSACKAKGIAVMLDIVANHMGPPSSGSGFREFTPFNSTEHYHGTLSTHCSDINADQHQREICWLANLGDLKQEDPWVTQQLINWMADLQKEYAFDGVRIDTVPYVNQTFWHQFQQHGLGGTSTYSVGECLVKDLWDGYDASYQTATGHEGYTGPLLGGVLNYKLFDAIRGALMYGGGMENVQQVYEKNAAAFTDVGALGNFVENHDQTRWLLTNPDHRSYQNGLTAAFFLPGVPIAYYGTEQGMAGGQSDNDKRQALWRHGGYNTTSRLYQWTKGMVSARKRMLRNSSVATIDVVHNFHSEDKFLSFERNGAVVIIAATIDPKTKQPLEGQTVVTVPTEFEANIELCDALLPTKGQYIQPDLIDSVPTKISAMQSQCSTTLAQLCGLAKRKGQVECGICVGEHEQQLLRQSNCTIKDVEAFCDAARPDPIPTPPPPGCEASSPTRIDCNSQAFKDPNVCTTHNCCWDATRTPNCFEKGVRPAPPTPTPSPPSPPPTPTRPVEQCATTGAGGMLRVTIEGLPRVFFAKTTRGTPD